MVDSLPIAPTTFARASKSLTALVFQGFRGRLVFFDLFVHAFSGFLCATLNRPFSSFWSGFPGDAGLRDSRLDWVGLEPTTSALKWRYSQFVKCFLKQLTEARFLVAPFFADGIEKGKSGQGGRWTEDLLVMPDSPRDSMFAQDGLRGFPDKLPTTVTNSEISTGFARCM